MTATMQLEPEVTEALAGSIVGADLYRAVIAVERSAARDNSRPALAGIHMEIAPDRVLFVAADGFRLSHAGVPITGHERAGTSVLLRRDQLVQTARAMRKAKAVTLEPMGGDYWLFRAPEMRLVTAVSVIDSLFPNWRAVIQDVAGDAPEFFVSLEPKFLADTAATAGEEAFVQLLRRAGKDTPPRAVVVQVRDKGMGHEVLAEHVIMPLMLGAH